LAEEGFPADRILSALLALNNTSVRQFARELGMDHSSVNQVLKGKNKRGTNAHNVYEALEIDNPYI